MMIYLGGEKQKQNTQEGRACKKFCECEGRVATEGF